MKILLYLSYFFRSVYLRGFINTIKLLSAEIRYEQRFGIKTSAIKKNDSAEFFHYQGASYLILSNVFKTLPIHTKGFEFLDIGSGKGRAVFVAEYAGYNYLTGIELDNELVKVARKNSDRYTYKRKESTITFINTNALTYIYKNTPTIYFLFNPFNERVLKQVLDRILAATNSETWFVYMNPLFTKPFIENKLEKVQEFKTKNYAEAVVYKKSRS